MQDNDYKELKKQIRKDIRKLLLQEFNHLDDFLNLPDIEPYRIFDASRNYDKISEFAQEYINTHRIDAFKHHIIDKYSKRDNK